MEELGIGRPSTYAVDPRRAARPRIRADREEAARRRGQGPPRHRLPRELLPPLRRVRLHRRPRGAARPHLQPARSTGSRSCAISGATSPPRSARPRSCASTEVLDALNELLGAAHLPAEGRRRRPARLPDLRQRPALAEARQVRRLHRLLELSRMPLHPPARGVRASGEAESFGDEGTPRRQASRRGSGDRPAGDPARRPLRPVRPARRGGREGREAEALLAADGRRRRRRSTSSGRCSSWPCRARSRAHPESGEPILVGIGRYGPYVQHGKTYANLEKDDDVLAIGANRAIDLIVAKESGAGFRRGGAARPGPRARRGSRHRQDGRGEGRPLRPLRHRRRGQRDAAAGDVAPTRSRSTRRSRSSPPAAPQARRRSRAAARAAAPRLRRQAPRRVRRSERPGRPARKRRQEKAPALEAAPANPSPGGRGAGVRGTGGGTEGRAGSAVKGGPSAPPPPCGEDTTRPKAEREGGRRAWSAIAGAGPSPFSRRGRV